MTAEPPGTNCIRGGTRIDVGIDDGTPGGTAGNSVLEDAEIDQTTYLCIHADFVVFLTNAITIGGSVGGLAGADAICQAEATAAGLDGVFMAWLSDGVDSPSTRFTRAGPYILVDGTTVASSWGDLTDGALEAAIRLNAAGVEPVAPGGCPLSSVPVWTATAPDGTPGGTSCGAWTGGGATYPGMATSTTATWTQGGSLYSCNFGCNSDQGGRLYCFEQ
jgi:hypothetical protein